MEGYDSVLLAGNIGSVDKSTGSERSDSRMSKEARDGKSENSMKKEEVIAQLKDLICDRKAFIDKSEANSVFQDDIDALIYAVDFLQKDTKPTPVILTAIKTLDAVIPPPGNKMVDQEHLPIAQAWKTIREQLLQPKGEA